VLDAKRRNDVQPGATVKVVEKQNQKTGQMTEGVVKKVLTSSAVHPHGIKVILESGVVGRVIEIIKNKNPLI
jgi:uncharacterized repeat protein (TIGR03833 family)